MRPLILAVLLASAPAARAVVTRPAMEDDGTGRADWLREGVGDRERAALTGQGWRLEEDGRALDPKTKAPATKARLQKAVLDLRQGARRAALETVDAMLASGKPLDAEDRRRIETLSTELPPALVAALLDPNSDVNKAKAMASANLASVAAYFDGGRTLLERRAAAAPVAAGAPGPRVELPYFSAGEKSVGNKLRASAASVLGRVPYGRTILGRLDGENGVPDLPAIVIEDQSGSVAAQYDFRRGAVVLDRESVLASVVSTVPPPQASALRLALASRAALTAYLDAHPEAVAAVAKDNDVLLAHELTHAWQDRRDGVLREIARGNVPDTQPLEYEEEAYAAKNLYLHSKLKKAPASVKMDAEFADYLAMTHGRASWAASIYKDLNDSSPSRALPLKTVQQVQAARVEALKGRAVATSEDQLNKALDLEAAGRGTSALSGLAAAHAARKAAFDAEIDAAALEADETLARFYLAQAKAAKRSTDRAAFLDQAEAYARESGNAILAGEVRREKNK